MVPLSQFRILLAADVGHAVKWKHEAVHDSINAIPHGCHRVFDCDDSLWLLASRRRCFLDGSNITVDW